MGKNQYSEAKILEVLKEYNSGIAALEVCRKHNIAKSTSITQDLEL